MNRKAKEDSLEGDCEKGRIWKGEEEEKPPLLNAFPSSSWPKSALRSICMYHECI